jgi:hypothetical protein
VPGSRLEILEGSGHFLPMQDADRLATLVDDFVATTEAASADDLTFLAALRQASAQVGAVPQRHGAAAGTTRATTTGTPAAATGDSGAEAASRA